MCSYAIRRRPRPPTRVGGLRDLARVVSLNSIRTFPLRVPPAPAVGSCPPTASAPPPARTFHPPSPSRNRNARAAVANHPAACLPLKNSDLHVLVSARARDGTGIAPASCGGALGQREGCLPGMGRRAAGRATSRPLRRRGAERAWGGGLVHHAPSGGGWLFQESMRRVYGTYVSKKPMIASSIQALERRSAKKDPSSDGVLPVPDAFHVRRATAARIPRVDHRDEGGWS